MPGDAAMTDEALWVRDLGVVEYREALALQNACAPRARPIAIPDTLLLLEHPPVYTRGRRSLAGELPLGEDFYRDAGIDIVDVDRGGKVTYHGPGQLVGYPIIASPTASPTCARSSGRSSPRSPARHRARARPDDGPDSPASGRASARSRRSACTCARRNDARLRAERRQRPRAVRVGGRLRPADGVQMTSVREKRARRRAGAARSAARSAGRQQFAAAFERTPSRVSLDALDAALVAA